MPPNDYPKKAKVTLAKGAQALAGTALGVASSWIAYSNLFIDHHLLLPDAIPADRHAFFSQAAGKISYYVDRSKEGTPVLLVHSINAAASAYEMRPLFERFRPEQPTFAMDLPGYGFSDRTARQYNAELFAGAILDLLSTQIGEPAHVIALSLGSEFAARAALYEPERFRSLTLISPTGFASGKEVVGTTQKAGVRGGSDLFYALISVPLWRRAIYDLIVTRRSIEYFLQQSFEGPIPLGLVDYAYATAHQPGAEFVPLYFLSGKLFTSNVLDTIYANVVTPTLVIYDRDAFVSFERLPEHVQQHNNWQKARITPTRGLPHFEQLQATYDAVQAHWKTPGQKAKK
jgi:pimeloyl-ACP methyl ester carboxylesterase